MFMQSLNKIKQNSIRYASKVRLSPITYSAE